MATMDNRGREREGDKAIRAPTICLVSLGPCVSYILNNGFFILFRFYICAKSMGRAMMGSDDVCCLGH